MDELELDASKALSPYRLMMLKSHSMCPWGMYYTLYRNPFKIFERLQKQQILVPLAMDKMAKWFKSFVIVPKPNGTV